MNPPLVSLTLKAAEYIQKLLEKENIKTPPGGIRFRIKAGGCHGLECVHELTKTDDRHDMIIISRGVRVLVDPKSAEILKGMIVDHTENLIEKGLTYNIPNSTSCGCGTSFELKKNPR